MMNFPKPDRVPNSSTVYYLTKRSPTYLILQGSESAKQNHKQPTYHQFNKKYNVNTSKNTDPIKFVTLNQQGKMFVKQRNEIQEIDFFPKQNTPQTVKIVKTNFQPKVINIVHNIPKPKLVNDKIGPVKPPEFKTSLGKSSISKYTPSHKSSHNFYRSIVTTNRSLPQSPNQTLYFSEPQSELRNPNYCHCSARIIPKPSTDPITDSTLFSKLLETTLNSLNKNLQYINLKHLS